MTDEELRTLILGDSEAKGFADVGNDSSCAERCRAIAPTERHPVSNLDVKRQAILDQYWGKVAYTAQDLTADKNVRILCINVGDWLRDTQSTTNFDLPETKAMLAGLVATGLVTQPQADTLDAMANQPPVITGEQVSRALLPLRTDGKVKVL